MSRRFGGELNGVNEPLRKQMQTGKISTVGDGGKQASVTNMSGSQLRNLMPIAPFGIASSPPVGLLAYTMVLDSQTNNGIIGVYDPNRPSVASGDITIYSAGGAKVECIGSKVLVNGIDIDELDDRVKKLEGK